MNARTALKNGIVIPGITLPNQRRLTGGKNLDGSFWIEIEGQGRVTMPPENVFQMCVGFLKAMGIELQVHNQPSDTLK